MIIYLRVSFIRRTNRRERLREQWEPVVLSYLAGDITLGQAKIRLRVGRRELPFFTDFISEYLGSLAGDEREKLIRLLRELKLADYEVKKLKRRNVWVRVFALNNLGLIKEKWTIPIIKAQLKHPNPLVFYAAAEALSSMSEAASFDEVAATLLKRPHWNRIRTAEIFLRYGREAAERLAKFLHDEEVVPERKALVIDILSEYEATEVAEDLLRLAEQTTDLNIKVSVIKYLGRISYLDAQPFLTAALKDENWVIRGQAAKSLGKIGNPEAIDKLLPLLRDKVWWVRYLAAQALATVGPEGVKQLRSIEATDDDKFAREISAQIISEMELSA